MSPTRRIITVDGLAGSGKSTLARELAGRMGYHHLNSGLLYRALGLAALCSGVDDTDPSELRKLLEKSKVRCIAGPNAGTLVLLNDRDVTNQLDTLQVASLTSSLSALPEVRQKLLSLQREAFEDQPLVAEGRDMGTVVFPDAPVKFFVTAPIDIRADRRLRQLASQGHLSTNFREVQEELRLRDGRDTTRETAPAKAAPDAVEIDNGDRPLHEVLEAMYALAALRYRS